MQIFIINVHVEIKMLILSILIAWTFPGCLEGMSGSTFTHKCTCYDSLFTYTYKQTMREGERERELWPLAG